MYSSQEEYDDAMSAGAYEDMKAQHAAEIYKEIEELELQKVEIQAQINQLLNRLP